MKKYAIILILIFCITELFASILILQSIFFPIRYEDLIIKYSKENSLTPSLVASVINVESSYKKNAQSKAGAIGLMQILPSTAGYISSIKSISYSNENDLLNPEINIEIGCAYLKYLIDKFDNIYTALASYNAGETVVLNWLKNPEYSADKKTLNFIPYEETREYIKKIKTNNKIYKILI